MLMCASRRALPAVPLQQRTFNTFAFKQFLHKYKFQKKRPTIFDGKKKLEKETDRNF
jgi:hypothetical protein